MAKMTNSKYSALVDKKSPPTRCAKNCVWAFLVGGAICVAGQILNNVYVHWGLTAEQAKMAVPVTLIFLACVATGLRIFDKIAAVGIVLPAENISFAVSGNKPPGHFDIPGKNRANAQRQQNQKT